MQLAHHNSSRDEHNQDIISDREYSLTMAGVVTTTLGGGDRAIVIDSDQENLPITSEPE